MSWSPTAATGEWNDGAAISDGDHGSYGDVNLNNDTTVKDGGDDSFKCRRCGESGHMARNCPSAPEGSGNDGNCFNCGEAGHTKAECTKPRVFKGECRLCKQVGHPASECPTKPAPKCFNCKEEGHVAADCKNNRVFDHSDVEDLTAEDAWKQLLQADTECDLDGVRGAVKAYSRAVPEVTYYALEDVFRKQSLNTYLIATAKELPKTHTYVNLQGELDKTYQVGFHLSDKPKRANAVSSWPKDAEDNLERLKDAGLPMERGIPKCTRCDELGHNTRSCPQEASEITERVQVKCVNCDEVGHRARDCPTPRVDKFACRNCKQSGHQSSECPEPRSAEGVECKRCNEMGHFARDCPNSGGNKCRNCGEEGHMAKECDKPRNPENVTCRNCDETGHFSRECPKPRDYSRVKCSNCGEMGHTKVRCKAPAAEEGDGGDASFAGGETDNQTLEYDEKLEGTTDGDGWGASTGNQTTTPITVASGGW